LNASINASGLYSVTATVGGCASAPGTTAVTVGPPAKLVVQSAGGNLILSWTQGVLQSASSITGPWSDVIGASSPYTNSLSASQAFYRLKLQ
jgi:hypothetical protein